MTSAYSSYGLVPCSCSRSACKPRLSLIASNLANAAKTASATAAAALAAGGNGIRLLAGMSSSLSCLLSNNTSTTPGASLTNASGATGALSRSSARGWSSNYNDSGLNDNFKRALHNARAAAPLSGAADASGASAGPASRGGRTTGPRTSSPKNRQRRTKTRSRRSSSSGWLPQKKGGRLNNLSLRSLRRRAAAATHATTAGSSDLHGLRTGAKTASRPEG